MIYLLASIVFATSINIVLRYFKKWDVDTFQSIVFNYWTCSVFGFAAIAIAGQQSTLSLDTEWMPFALILGIIFIVGFNIAAATIRYYGITLATILQKLSLVLTVIYAILVFGESSGLLKLIGIACAIPAIILININTQKDTAHYPNKLGGIYLILLPFLIFLINGIIETSFFYVKETGKLLDQDLSFVTMIFFTAAILGTLWWWIMHIKSKNTFHIKNLKAGIILGLPNFGSIYFLVKALSSAMEGSVIIPINNISILILSGIAGWFLFKERFSKINFIGFGLAVISIVLISFFSQ